jgi:hypothetical protein
MHRRAILALLGLATLSSSCARCGGRGRDGETTIVRDPVSDAMPPLVPSPLAPDRVLADARIVDVRKTSLACALSPDLPLREVSDGTRAFVLSKDLVLRAFDLGCSGELWHATAPACDALLVSADHVFCSTHTSITWWPATTKRVRGSDVTADGKPVALGTSSPIAQVLAIDGRLMVFHDSTALEVFESDTLSPFYSVKLPIRSWGQGFVPTVKPAGACGVMETGKTFHLVCIDSLGALRLSKAIVVAKPTDPPFSRFLVRMLDGRYLLVSSMWSSGPKRAVVVRVADGVEVARVEDEIAAVVTRVEDGSVEGLIATTPKMRLLETNGATRWTDATLPYVQDSAVAVAKGDRIYVVNFPMISTGAAPLAFERATGKLLWAGDFEQLSVAHSAYSNGVAIALHATNDGDVLAVRGSESMVTYLQLFDVRDGKRRYSQTRYAF